MSKATEGEGEKKLEEQPLGELQLGRPHHRGRPQIAPSSPLKAQKTLGPGQPWTRVTLAAGEGRGCGWTGLPRRGGWGEPETKNESGKFYNYLFTCLRSGAGSGSLQMAHYGRGGLFKVSDSAIGPPGFLYSEPPFLSVVKWTH